MNGYYHGVLLNTTIVTVVVNARVCGEGSAPEIPVCSCYEVGDIQSTNSKKRPTCCCITMGHRYTFYRYVDRSSRREDLYERWPFQRYWISLTSSNLCRLCFACEGPFVASRHFYRYRRLVRRRTLLQPGVSFTLRRTRREVVASC